jgi:hypothetical protein
MKKTLWPLIVVFCLAGAATVRAQDTPPLRPFFSPRLIISNIKVTPDDQGFVITFGYKNVGTGALPKASDMPEKPSYQVQIDGRQISHGSLIIPAFQAAPGWEVATFYGGAIKYPLGPGMDYSWFVGNMITVKINENKVAGMNSDSQTYNLKSMALQYSYDAMIAGVSLDWVKETMTITVRIEGHTGSLPKFKVFNGAEPFNFIQMGDVVPGQHLYTVTRKMGGIRTWSNYTAQIYVVLCPTGNINGYPDVHDIDMRNNGGAYPFHK